MSVYKHTKLKPLRLLAKGLRGLVGLFKAWPVLLIIAFLVSPVGPYLRWSYEYRDLGGNRRVYVACRYLGAGGFIDHMRGDNCPLIIMIDQRER